jgi:hypothetical protein
VPHKIFRPGYRPTDAGRTRRYRTMPEANGQSWARLRATVPSGHAVQ